MVEVVCSAVDVNCVVVVVSVGGAVVVSRVSVVAVFAVTVVDSLVAGVGEIVDSGVCVSLAVVVNGVSVVAEQNSSNCCVTCMQNCVVAELDVTAMYVVKTVEDWALLVVGRDVVAVCIVVLCSVVVDC